VGVNATLIAEVITFALFIWITMTAIWPPLSKALDERQKKIADGLAAAERGHRELELAQHKATDNMRDGKIKAAQIIEQANIRANQIIEESKQKARDEGLRLLEIAKADIDKEKHSAREQLRAQVASIAVAGAQKILQKNIDAAANRELISSLVDEL